jgi:CBS domain-containing protein
MHRFPSDHALEQGATPEDAMKVGNAMTKDVWACQAEEPATSAARIMWERDCGCVPVVDPMGHAIGIVTDRDLCMASYLRGTSLEGLTIDSVMSRAPVCCRASDALEDAELAMANARVRRLPVTDEDGRLIGMLSMNDVIRARMGSPIERLRESVVGDALTALARIGEHRSEDVQLAAE